MKRRSTLALLAVAAVFPSFAAAADVAGGMPGSAEAPFVSAATRDLTARFSTPAEAIRAGYLRFTDEDETGAISYANRQWTSADETHPSQLWYDAAGRLIGADFSVPYDAASPPHLFGLAPSRWQKFGLHVHYGLEGPDNTTVYGAIGPKKLVAAGGSAENPTPAALVAAGVAKSPADVRFVFTFPAIWDVGVWLIPNPDGAFAEKNPTLKPTSPKGSM